MNVMYYVMSPTEIIEKIRSNKLKEKITSLQTRLKKERLKISDKFTTIGDMQYYHNVLPNVNKDRDVLTKPLIVCKMRVNWKKKSFDNLSTAEAFLELKEQFGWKVTVVDKEHTRNKYKHKTEAWVIFDTEEKAKKAMRIFNEMFMTAMEQDAVDEYKHFKKNPDKRVLSFDKILPNAYDLYEKVDKGEL